MKNIVLNSGYNTDPDQWSVIHGTENNEPSMTQQSFAAEADINTIVKRFGVTGELPNVVPAQYGDFSNVTDYHTAMNAIRDAGQGFMALDPSIRSFFENDPANLISFLSDPANRPKALELGLVLPSIPAGDVKPIDGVPVNPNP